MNYFAAEEFEKIDDDALQGHSVKKKDTRDFTTPIAASMPIAAHMSIATRAHRGAYDVHRGGRAHHGKDVHRGAYAHRGVHAHRGGQAHRGAHAHRGEENFSYDDRFDFACNDATGDAEDDHEDIYFDNESNRYWHEEFEEISRYDQEKWNPTTEDFFYEEDFEFERVDDVIINTGTTKKKFLRRGR